MEAITAQDIKSEIDGHTDSAIAAAWRERNNAGEGFAFDADDADNLRYVGTVDMLEVYEDDTAYTIVGDSHGAWAVRVQK